MKEITKCINDSCKIKKNCYRFTSPESVYWQAWARFGFSKEKNSCEHFIENEKK